LLPAKYRVDDVFEIASVDFESLGAKSRRSLEAGEKSQAIAGTDGEGTTVSGLDRFCAWLSATACSPEPGA
jgi:hypothetical protein